MAGAPSRPQRLFSLVPHPQLGSMKAANVERRKAEKPFWATRLLKRKKGHTGNKFFFWIPLLTLTVKPNAERWSKWISARFWSGMFSSRVLFTLQGFLSKKKKKWHFKQSAEDPWCLWIFTQITQKMMGGGVGGGGDWHRWEVGETIYPLVLKEPRVSPHPLRALGPGGYEGKPED